MAPRVLVRMLAKHELALKEYVLVHIVAELEADQPEGIDTTNEFLAHLLEADERTVRRTLRTLREKGLVDYQDHERVAIFTIHTGPMLRTLLRTSVRTPLRSPETSRVSADAADNPASPTTRKPPSTNARPADTPADSSRARNSESESDSESSSTTTYVSRETAPALRTKSPTPAQEQEERAQRRPPRRNTPSEPERLGHIDPRDYIDPD
jgi:hypothetical protein